MNTVANVAWQARVRCSFIPDLLEARLLNNSVVQELTKEQRDRPSLPRSGHAAAALPPTHTHDLLVFGGYTEDGQKRRQATNEAWLFSLDRQAWSPVQYTGNKVPRERLVSQAVVLGHSLYILGGWDPGHRQDGGEILKDIWRLDLRSFAWEEIHPEGPPLQPFSRHQAAAIGTKIYIHTHRNTKDLLCLDVTDLQHPKLSVLPMAGPSGSPTSRGLHSMTAVGNQLFIYAGAPKQGGMLGDLWELDLAKAEWSEIDADGQMPHVRCSHGAAPSGQSVYFFGGSYYREEGGLEPLHDLFAYDTLRRSWRHANRIPGSPAPRNAHSLTALADGRLLLYGGWEPFKETYNDTFLLDPSLLEWSSQCEQDEDAW